MARGPMTAEEAQNNWDALQASNARGNMVRLDAGTVRVGGIPLALIKPYETSEVMLLLANEMHGGLVVRGRPEKIRMMLTMALRELDRVEESLAQ